MNESMNVIYLIEKEKENVAVVECIGNVQWALFDALIEKWAVKVSKVFASLCPSPAKIFAGTTILRFTW